MPENLLSLNSPAIGLIDINAGEFDMLRDWLQAQQSKIVARIVRGGKSRTLVSFYDEAAAACQFPYYFGGNWMAFEECTTDLGEGTGASYFLLIHSASQLLADEPDSEFETAIQVWTTIAQQWQSPEAHALDPARIFRVILQEHGYDLSVLAQRLEQISQPFFYVTSPF